MRVAVLIKHKNERKWHVPDVQRVPESRLQTILSEDPDLIPFDDERRPVVMVHEFAVSFGSVDLVGVGATGSITIGECKKAENPEIRRTVVGQLFAYAAAIWGMSYEEFDDVWQAKTRPPLMDDATWAKRKQPPLADAVRVAAEERGLPFDAEAFRAAVSENLRAGRFTLVIAVDEITSELQRVIEFLSGHMGAGVAVIALELGYVSHGDVEVLIPQQFGLEMAERRSALERPSRQWDAESFDAQLGTVMGEWATSMVADLLDWARKTGLDIWYGAGAKHGTVYAGLTDKDGKRRALVSYWTSGMIEIEFSQWKYLPPFDSREARVDVLGRLTSITGVRKPDEQANSWPTFELESLRRPDAIAKFKALLDDVVSRIRAAG